MTGFPASVPMGAPEPTSAPPAAYPIQRYGLVFGSVAGLIALVQVGVSVVSALENRYTLTNLYFSASGGDVAQASALLATFPLLIAAYGSALIGCVFSLVLCWQAGRAAALETARAGAGAEAGLLVSVTGAVIWVIASILAVVLVHTDGSLAGVVTASARLSPATDAREIAILVSQETLAILFGLGAAALVGWLAGGSAVATLRRQLGISPLGPLAYGPPHGPYAPYRPAGPPHAMREHTLHPPTPPVSPQP